MRGCLGEPASSLLVLSPEGEDLLARLPCVNTSDALIAFVFRLELGCAAGPEVEVSISTPLAPLIPQRTRAHIYARSHARTHVRVHARSPCY